MDVHLIVFCILVYGLVGIEHFSEVNIVIVLASRLSTFKSIILGFISSAVACLAASSASISTFIILCTTSWVSIILSPKILLRWHVLYTFFVCHIVGTISFGMDVAVTSMFSVGWGWGCVCDYNVESLPSVGKIVAEVPSVE